MVKISGAKAFTERLGRMRGSRATSLTGKALYAAGQLIEIEAENSITEGSISGPGHIPSLPGEPPNADTRQLDGDIHTVGRGRGRVNVESIAPYSAALEFGTSKMAARPYMNPAAQKKSPEAKKLVAEAIRRSTK